MRNKSLDFKFLREGQGGRNTEDRNESATWNLMESKKELLLFGYFKSQMCCKSYSLLRSKKSEEVKKIKNKLSLYQSETRDIIMQDSFQHLLITCLNSFIQFWVQVYCKERDWDLVRSPTAPVQYRKKATVQMYMTACPNKDLLCEAMAIYFAHYSLNVPVGILF